MLYVNGWMIRELEMLKRIREVKWVVELLLNHYRSINVTLVCLTSIEACL